MRAIILVGGFGTRLRPLTLDTPKQMLPVVGITMFERVIARLGACGVDQAIVSLGFRPDRFTEAFPDSHCAGVELHYAIEPEPLDTAGAIAFAAADAGVDETFLVVNGDVLTDLDYAWLVQRHRDLGAEATLHLIAVEDPSRFGVVLTDDTDRVLEFIEKPPAGTAASNLINAGTYVMEPSVLARIPAGRKVSVERETFPQIVADGSLFAVASDVYWLDAGTPAAYLQANLDLIDGVRSSEDAIFPSADIDATARIEHSVIGSGSSVGSGAVVTDSVIMAGARIGNGAVIRGSIVAGGAVVGEGCSIVDGAVIGSGMSVEAGSELVGGSIPDPSTWQ